MVAGLCRGGNIAENGLFVRPEHSHFCDPAYGFSTAELNVPLNGWSIKVYDRCCLLISNLETAKLSTTLMEALLSSFPPPNPEANRRVNDGSKQ
jgi:hypothetical protein